MSKRLELFQNVMELRAAMEAVGIAHDPVYELMWDLAVTDTARGAEMRGKLVNIVEPRVAAQQILASRQPVAPAVHPADAICIGASLTGNTRVLLDVNILNRHVLLIGTSGSGKTNAIALLLRQLLRRGISAEFIDHKSEGRRFSEAAVFRPDQQYWNMLDPVGPAETYWQGWSGEFGKAYNLRPETWTELLEVLKCLHLGRKPGAPFPSLRDFERVLRKVAKAEGRSKLLTAAHALSALNALLGKTALIRGAPDCNARRQLIVYECQGLPHRMQNFLSALRLLRRQLQTAEAGHSTRLNHVQVMDEAGEVFGKELAQYEGSGYVAPHKRAITQMRSSGVGILAGVQIPSDIDDALKSNVSTILCFKCPNPKDAKEAAALLGLPGEMMGDLQTLPVGVAYVRSEGFSCPEKVRLPLEDLGPYPSNADVAERMAPEFTWLDAHTVFAPERSSDMQPIAYDELLGEDPPATPPPESTPLSVSEVKGKVLQDHFALLRDVAAHGKGGVAERYQRIGLSAGKGNRVKKDLLALGLITNVRGKSANGRPCELLTITSIGKDLLHEQQTR